MQANSNFRDASAQTETIADDGVPGIAGPQRIPQVRYICGALGNFLVAEQPSTKIYTPAGNIASDSTNQVVNTTAGLVPANNGGTGTCVANGFAVTNASGCTLTSNPTKASAPDLTFSQY